MVRRKGEMTKRRAEREYPFAVEIEVPPRGLGERLMEIHRWCRQRTGDDGYVATGRLDGLRDFAVYRFKDRQAADDFVAWIDGKVVPALFSRRTFT